MRFHSHVERPIASRGQGSAVIDFVAGIAFILVECAGVFALAQGSPTRPGGLVFVVQLSSDSVFCRSESRFCICLVHHEGAGS